MCCCTKVSFQSVGRMAAPGGAAVAELLHQSELRPAHRASALGGAPAHARSARTRPCAAPRGGRLEPARGSSSLASLAFRPCAFRVEPCAAERFRSVSYTRALRQRICGASACVSYTLPSSQRSCGSAPCDLSPANPSALSLSSGDAPSQRAPARGCTELARSMSRIPGPDPSVWTPHPFCVRGPSSNRKVLNVFCIFDCARLGDTQ